MAHLCARNLIIFRQTSANEYNIAYCVPFSIVLQEQSIWYWYSANTWSYIDERFTTSLSDFGFREAVSGSIIYFLDEYPFLHLGTGNTALVVEHEKTRSTIVCVYHNELCMLCCNFFLMFYTTRIMVKLCCQVLNLSFRI